MKKQILPLFAFVLFCLAVLCPACASAAVPLDTDAQASLTLYYQKDHSSFADLQIGIYRIAETLPDGSHRLVEPYSSYPINIHGITAQEQWNRVAQTLRSYIVADQVIPDRVGTTDKNGSISFSDLEMGLYFVGEAVAENSSGTYIFNQFLVYVPTPQPDGTYLYEVDARPKCTGFSPKTQYTVTKLWQDEGNENKRPGEIIVDIYKDGVLYETQILSTDNNWSYTWSVSGEDHGQWVVAERSVPEGYQVTVQQNGSTFSITNTCPDGPGEQPPTGDSFAPLPWLLAMCFSGMLLLILGLYGRRRG